MAERAPIGRSADQIRDLLRDQESAAWYSLLVLLVLDAIAACGAVVAAGQGFIVASALGFTALILATGRAVRRLQIARARVRRLTRHDGLPRAVVHRR